jgi:hypothetical protein
MIEQGYRANRQIQSEYTPTLEEINKRIKDAGVETAPSANSIVNEQATQLYGGLAKQQMSNASGMAKGAVGAVETAANVIPDVANAVLSGMKELDSWALSKGLTREHLINPQTKPFEQFNFAPKADPGQEFSYSMGAMAAQLLSFGVTTIATESKAAGVLAGGATAATVMDPKAPRLSDFVKDTPVVGPLAELLASKPDDSAAMSRFKNSIEAMGIDAALAPIVMKAVGWYRGYKSAAETLTGLGTKVEQVATETKPIAEAVVPGSPKTFAETPPPTAPTPLKSIEEILGSDYLKGLPPDQVDNIKSVLTDMRRENIKVVRDTGNVFKGMTPSEIDQHIKDSVLSTDGGKFGINFDPYKNADSSVTGMGKSAEQLAQEASQVGKTGPKPDSVVFADAASIVGDSKKMTELLNKPSSSAFTDVEVTALNMELHSSESNARWVLDTIRKQELAGGEVSSDMLAALENNLTYFSNVFAKYNAAAESSGRSLRMFNYAFDPKAQKEALGSYMELVGGSVSTREKAAMLNELLDKDPNNLMKVAQQQGESSATFGQALYEMYVQNMLSPVTAVKVGFSNLTQHITETLARNMAAKIALKEGNVDMANIMSYAASEQQKALYQSVGAELSSGIKTLMENINDMGWRALKPSELTKGMRYDYRQSPAMSGQALGIQNRIGSGIVDALGESSKLGAMPLQLVDKYSDAVAIKTEGAYRATMKGMEKGLAGEELATYVENATKERPIRPALPTKATPEQARKFAQDMEQFNEYNDIWKQVDDYRNKIKFQQTPDTGVGGKLYEMVAQNDTRILGVPAFRAVSPFVRNNINMAQAALDAIPGIRGLSPRNQEILKAGGTEAYLLKARMRIMNNIMMAGAAGGMTGLLYGMGSMNKDVAQVQKERGYNPYSFMNTANYDNLGTAGIVGAIATDIGFLAKYYASGAVDEKWNTDFVDATTYITASVADKLTIDDAFIDLWHGMSHFKEDPKGVATGGAIRSLNTLALPSAGTFNAVRKLIDPTKRQTKSDALGVIQNIIMDLANRIPGVNKALEPALDTLGYPITEKYGAIRLVTEFDPDFLQKNKVLKGLTDLGMAGALVTPHPEGMSKDTMAIHPMGKSLILKGTAEAIALTPVQYNEMVLMSLGKTEPGKPGIVEEMISGILSSNKSDALKKLQILKIMESRRAAAKVQIVQKYPELKDKWRALVQQRASAYGADGTDYLKGSSMSDSQGPLGADFMGD